LGLLHFTQASSGLSEGGTGFKVENIRDTSTPVFRIKDIDVIVVSSFIPEQYR
jgi:hypothetical protein